MRITENAYGNFYSEDFTLYPISTTKYVPLLAINTFITLEGLLFYSKPSFKKFQVKANTIKNIREGFESGLIVKKIPINNKNYYISKGVIFSEEKLPLMVLALFKDAYLDDSVSKFSEEEAGRKFSYKNYVLFYSTSFFTEPSLAPLNRRLQKEILQSCYEKGIEVRVLPSSEIEKNTFASLFEVKKTKSLTQLEAYMEQVLPTFLYTEEEDTFQEEVFERVELPIEEELPQQELSIEEEALLFDESSREPEEYLEEYTEELEDEELEEEYVTEVGTLDHNFEVQVQQRAEAALENLNDTLRQQRELQSLAAEGAEYEIEEHLIQPIALPASAHTEYQEFEEVSELLVIEAPSLQITPQRQTQNIPIELIDDTE